MESHFSTSALLPQIHLRALVPRPADIAVPRRPGTDGATRVSATQHRRGAWHHATPTGQPARSDQAQLSSRTGRYQPRQRLDPNHRPNQRPQRTDRRRPTNSQQAWPRFATKSGSAKRVHDRAHDSAEPGAAAARHGGPTAGHRPRTREHQRVRFDARRQCRRLGGPNARRFEHQPAMQRRPRRAAPAAPTSNSLSRRETTATLDAAQRAAAQNVQSTVQHLERAVGNGRRQSAGSGHH